MQYTIFVAVAPIALVIVLLVGIVAWRRRNTRPSDALLALSVSTFGWITFNTLELLSPFAPATLLWARVTYIFIAAAPVTWFIFALRYVGMSSWLRPACLALLGAVPTTTAVMALSNGAHGLLWRRYQFIPSAGLLHMRPTGYGPWFWIHIVYSYACILVGTGLILAHYVRSAKIYRRQARWVVAGALAPLVVNIIYVFQLIPGFTKDYSPLAFSVAAAFFAASIFRHRLLDLRPVGRYHLVQSLRDPVLVVDTEGQVVDANPAAHRVVENGDGELIGQPLPDALPAASSLLSSSANSTTDREDVSIEVEGRERWFELRLSDITDQYDQLIGHLIVLHDVTERIETTRRLRRQERLAAIGQLAGGIAHDFNNLIGSITLHAQLAERVVDERPEAVHENLEVIVEESRRAADLVDQILDFSRRQVIDTESLDLGPFVEEMAGILRRTIREDIRLVVETPPHPCVVDADPTRVQQVLLNLATNARDAMPHGGLLRIVVECAWSALDENGKSGRRWVRLIVSDTGTGMDEETRKHVFEPFFTTKRPDEGTGLGLAQVYGIVKQHGGRVEVETAPGEGSTFTVLLPVAEGADRRKDGTSDPSIRGSGETILVVEDTERYLRALREGLESLNYRVLTAADGQEALETLSGEQVDLLLTDLVMAEMGGEALLRRVHREVPDLKAVAMTGFARAGNGRALREAGFTAVVGKPFSMQRLASVVHDALNHRG